MRFDAKFNTNNTYFDVKFSENSTDFAADFNNIQVVSVTDNADYYTGDYEVIPTPSPVVLPTAQKIMQEDVTVHAIPFFTVGNTSGGDTVYIGTEKEITMI